MFKDFFLIFLLAHIVGDFYFQTDALAHQKERELSSMIKHCIYYGGACVLVAVTVFTSETIVAAVALAFSHCLIELAKFAYTNYTRKPKLESHRIYLLEQLAHFICIFIACYTLAVNNYEFQLIAPLEKGFETINASFMTVLSWIVMLLLIWKPANITIKQLLFLYKPVKKEFKDDKNAGAFIGILERLIILLLISVGQFAAIGFVLTAKSIVRYEKIVKEPSFAEYYLLGTLLSTVVVIVIFVGVM